MSKSAQPEIPTGVLADMGIALARFRCGQLRLIFREKPTQDHGIDAEIEILEGEKATGRLVSAQIKCGPSYFKTQTQEAVTFYFEPRHYEYWTSHSLPVIAILVDPEQELCLWETISEKNIQPTSNRYKIQIPKKQTLTNAWREKLVDLATPIVSSSAFELFDEADVSTGGVRRVSYYARLNYVEKGWTREEVRQLLLQLTSEARASEYFKNSISRKVHEGSSAQVVWVYLYQSEHDRNSANYIVKAVWIDPGLPKEFWPIDSKIKRDLSGLYIDWNENSSEQIRLLNELRASKAVYLQSVNSKLYIIDSVLTKYQTMCKD